MHKGRLLRIILVILIVGMGVFLFVRNNALKKEIAAGERTEITAKDFLPFGSSEGSFMGKIIDSISSNDNKNEEQKDSSKKNFEKIAENIAGMKIIQRDDEIADPISQDENGNKVFEKITAIRYVSRENGYVYDYLPKYKKSYLISDTAVPRVSFATFSPDGNQIMFQYLDTDLATQKSFLGSLGGGDVTMLADNIPSFGFGNDGSLVYVRLANSGSNIILRNPSGVESVLYSSPISEWNVSFLGTDRVLLTTKATEYAKGYSYIIDIKSKAIKKFNSGQIGLTTKASSLGGYILKSETVASGPKLSLFDSVTQSQKNINKLGLTEKCMFSNDDTAFVCALPKNFENKAYPDSWYLGEVETDDTLVRYTSQNLNERILANISDETNQKTDVFKIDTTNSGDIVAYINKIDMSLWAYEE